MPYRQAPLFVGDSQHRPHDVGHPLRMQDRHQRHRGAVGVPQREGRVVREAGCTVDFIIRPAVIAVHVAEHGGRHHRVVQRRVENPLRRLVLRRDLHLRQLVVPRLVGRRRGRLEIPFGKLRGEVRFGALDAHGRQGHLHEQLLAVGRRERRTGVFVPDGFELCKGFRELRREIDPLVFGPARRVAPSADARAVVREAEARVGRLVPAAAVLQVEDYGRGIRRREGVAVQSHTRRGRHLGRDAVARQWNRVVARPDDLPRAVGIGPESRRRIVLRAAGIGHLAHDGHHRDVEQVADPRTREVRVREADHRRIRPVVPRNPVPLLRNARGADLHHAERHVRPDENVAVAARADLRVHEAGEIALRSGLRRRAGRREKQGRRRQKNVYPFHSQALFIVFQFEFQSSAP